MYTERNSKNRLYSIWTEFRRRCRKPRTQSYIDKSLTYNPAWSEYNEFRNWALCSAYSDELSLERKDNDIGYEPSNCYWATKQEQQYNRDKRDGGYSKYIGVSEMKPSKRMKSPLKKPWRARVSKNGKEIYCETFSSEFDAASARDKFCLDNDINVVLNFVYDKS